MIQVTYNEVGDEMILRAEGHAGYAEKGKDIVCAAVSVLMQTLAYSVDADNTGNTFELSDGKNGNRLTVQAPMSVLNRDKFDLVVEGLIRLAENYPENVQFKKLCTKSVNVMDLQMFAEGGDGNGGSGDSGSGLALSGASRQLPQSGSPWQSAKFPILYFTPCCRKKSRQALRSDFTPLPRPLTLGEVASRKR